MSMFSFIRGMFGSKSAASVTGKLVLGRSLDGNGQPLALDDALLRNHVYMSGRQGSGMSILIEQMLTQQTERGRGWIYVDPLVDDALLDRLAERARKSGREDEFLVLDFHKPENSHSYDILRSGTPADRALRILQALPPASERNPGAEHYRQCALDVLTPLFAAIDATGKAVGLRELAMLLRGLEEETMQREFLDAIPLSHEARAAFLAAIGPGARDGGYLKQVLGGLAGRVYLLSTLDMSELLSAKKPEIVMSDVLANNKMLYVRLPVLMQSTLGLFARMVVQDAISSVSAREHLPRRLREQFLFVMNGYSALDLGLGGLAAVRAAAYSHARAMCVTLVPVESGYTLSEVVHAGEQSSEILIGNTYTKIYFRQHQDEVTRQLHTELRPGTLDALSLGEFMMWAGTAKYRGLVSNSQAEMLGGTYKRRAMPWAEERPRLRLASFAEQTTT
ncbi:hypothetical protein [Paraburkholderia sp. A3RO-2L]|uniref:hypothetical protein n=1 Tax=Paraburkholderia sp. A3RO-2L TaxID=3028376 RepID=UPI003DA8A47F